MRRRPVRTLLTAGALAIGLIGGPQVVKADGVGDAQRELQKAQDELDNLINQMGQLDEDYGAAQDRKAQLDADIVVSQGKIDEISAQLGDVQQVLSDLAVTRFTSGGNVALSPLFSNAGTYSLAEQKDALGKVALDTGEASADDLQSLVDDLAREQKKLQQQQDEANSLIQVLQDKQAQYDDLQKVYTQKLADAKAKFGEAKLQAEEERRAAAAQAAAAAAAPPSNNGGGTGNTPRGGGSTGGSSGSSGSSTPVNIPPVSGKAGIAVSAAYSQLGVPYRFAAEEPGVAFDCSGLTKWAWGRAGVYLPHQSAAQYGSLPHVPKDAAQPGDLIFYYTPIGHVGIYIGGGQMIHAPATGKTVEITVVHWNKVVGVGRPG